MTVHAAKEFIASRIATEAQLQGQALSDVEREMLYFTETGKMSAKMAAIADEFDPVSDQAAYG